MTTFNGKQVCSFCVMESSIPAITFDENGQCSCCKSSLARMPNEYWPGPEGQNKMADMVLKLKKEGQGKQYDAMIGLSGGIDSAYLAHLMVRKYGLRVLAVHVDGGWNSAPAVRNIETIARKLDLDLYTYVVEWQEMQDIQLAFLRASVLNQDNPQDHAFFSTLYRTAIEKNIKYFLSGVNFASENIIPPEWGHPYMDAKHIKAIHAQFGRQKLNSFPFMGLPEFIWHSRIIKRLKIYKPLNNINYCKDKAKQDLQNEYGWVDYGGKHHESRFTKFYQEIYLPLKYGFDKRRLHLSSLIVSGQLKRESALNELETQISTPLQIKRDTCFIAKKLGIGEEELNSIIISRPVAHSEYINQLWIISKIVFIKRAVQMLTKQ